MTSQIPSRTSNSNPTNTRGGSNALPQIKIGSTSDGSSSEVSPVKANKRQGSLSDDAFELVSHDDVHDTEDKKALAGIEKAVASSMIDAVKQALKEEGYLDDDLQPKDRTEQIHTHTNLSAIQERLEERKASSTDVVADIHKLISENILDMIRSLHGKNSAEQRAVIETLHERGYLSEQGQPIAGDAQYNKNLLAIYTEIKDKKPVQSDSDSGSDRQVKRRQIRFARTLKQDINNLVPNLPSIAHLTLARRYAGTLKLTLAQQKEALKKSKYLETQRIPTKEATKERDTIIKEVKSIIGEQGYKKIEKILSDEGYLEEKVSPAHILRLKTLPAKLQDYQAWKKSFTEEAHQKGKTAEAHYQDVMRTADLQQLSEHVNKQKPEWLSSEIDQLEQGKTLVKFDPVLADLVQEAVTRKQEPLSYIQQELSSANQAEKQDRPEYPLSVEDVLSNIWLVEQSQSHVEYKMLKEKFGGKDDFDQIGHKRVQESSVREFVEKLQLPTSQRATKIYKDVIEAELSKSESSKQKREDLDKKLKEYKPVTTITSEAQSKLDQFIGELENWSESLGTIQKPVAPEKPNIFANKKARENWDNYEQKRSGIQLKNRLFLETISEAYPITMKDYLPFIAPMLNEKRDYLPAEVLEGLKTILVQHKDITFDVSINAEFDKKVIKPWLQYCETVDKSKNPAGLKLSLSGLLTPSRATPLASPSEQTTRSLFRKPSSIFGGSKNNSQAGTPTEEKDGESYFTSDMAGSTSSLLGNSIGNLDQSTSSLAPPSPAVVKKRRSLFFRKSPTAPVASPSSGSQTFVPKEQQRSETH